MLEDVFVPDRYIARVVPAGAQGIDPFVLGILAWGLIGFGRRIGGTRFAASACGAIGPQEPPCELDVFQQRFQFVELRDLRDIEFRIGAQTVGKYGLHADILSAEDVDGVNVSDVHACFRNRTYGLEC